MTATLRLGPDGCSGDRTLNCPMHLKLEPRSPLFISSHRSTAFPPHGFLQLALRGATQLQHISNSGRLL